MTTIHAQFCAPTHAMPMSETERLTVSRSLSHLSHEHDFPFSRLYECLGQSVLEFPLEEVQLKDLAPKGWVFVAINPNYRLRWVFRIFELQVLPCGFVMALPEVEERGGNYCAERGVSRQAMRFPIRFMSQLKETLHISDMRIDSDFFDLEIEGLIKADHLGLTGDRPRYPFVLSGTRY
ncbi:hypothetical protein LUCX_278 [Xanthomonas phage vB_XciM_LucasX]|nr:hypothetical protein LUCX_278 [Xanthomonas phage vB_XciM_LucasX]